MESSVQKQRSNYDYYKQSSSQVKNFPYTNNSATKGFPKSSAKKDTSDADKSALILSKSARDLKKRDLFTAAKGVSQIPALVDTLNGSQGSPRDVKALNKDLNFKGAISKAKDPIRSSHISK